MDLTYVEQPIVQTYLYL